MKKRARKFKECCVKLYDRRGVLREVEERPVDFALEEELRKQIQGGRQRRLVGMIRHGGKVAVALPVKDCAKVEIKRFPKEDRLDPRTAAKVRRLLRKAAGVKTASLRPPYGRDPAFRQGSARRIPSFDSRLIPQE